MVDSSYQEKVIRLRKITAATQAIAEDRILETLKRAYADLTRLLNLANVDSLTYVNLFARRNSINEIIDELTKGIATETRLGMRGESENVIELYTAATNALSDRLAVNLQPSYDWIPRTAIDNVTTRVWSDGRTFSERLWNLDAVARNGINQVLSSGVARGQSAVDMSKELRRYLIDPEITPGTSWTTGVSKSVTGEGTIHSRALTLARTEINNSYRESLVLANDLNPITLGVKWNLSGSHPRPDICDVWAEGNFYGLGDGVYPADAAPIDHPNGLCYMTEVLRPKEQWDEDKPFIPQQETRRNEILAPVSGLSEGQQNAAWKAYNKVNDIVQKERTERQYAARRAA